MTTRNTTRFTGQALVLAFITAISFSQNVSAAPCDAEIDALKTALEDGICQFKRKKCKGLSRKLDKTQRKLEKGKFVHAARKLSDFGSRIEDMAMRRKPKISMTDYEALMDPFYVAAADCIASGGISTPVLQDDSPTPVGGDELPPPIKVPF